MRKKNPDPQLQPAILEPGVCRFCKCTEDNACVIRSAMFGQRERTCQWTDDTLTLCDHPRCVGRANNQFANPFVTRPISSERQRIRSIRKHNLLKVTKAERAAMQSRRAQLDNGSANKHGAA